MKKIKYLIGAFVFGVGLLFSSQSFARNIYVDGVSTADITSSTNLGSNYLYLFSVQVNRPYSSSANRWAFFGYQLYYNGLIQFNYLSDWYSYSSSVCNSYSSYLLNSSVYGFSGYNGSCNYVSSNQSYTLQNISTITSDSFDLGIRVLLGQNNLSGRNFITVGSSFDGLTSPKYGFGPGFFSTNDYLTVNESFSDYYRLFYKSISDGIGGYLNPLDYLDIATLAYSGLSSSHVVGEGWEYFYPKGTRTNYGYIVDDGQSYTKYKHFGLFDMGYSYTYGKVGQESTSISWDQLGFRTVSDSVESALKAFGSVSYDDLNNGVGTSRLSWNGLLLLRGNQYVSFGNDNGVYILSKDPNNLSRVLYEHYSCSLSDINVIFNGGNSIQSCVKLDGGYLTYNGSRSVLPFTDSISLYSISSIDNDYPLLYDLVNGGNGLTSMHGITRLGSSCLYINQGSRCYGFSPDSSVNIKETYLGSLPPSELPVGSGVEVSSRASFYYSCLGPIYNTPDGLPPVYCLNPDGTLINLDDYKNCYFNISSTNSGVFEYEIFCENGGYVQQMNWTPEGSGGSFSACYGDDCLAMFSFTPSSLSIATGFVLSTGLIEDMFTNLTGWIARCPFPYTDFQLGKNNQFLKYLKTLGFKYDPFIFINCVVAGFNYGRHSIDNTLFGDTFDSPLLNGDTPKHRALFTFLDFIVILGLFGLWGFIKKIF